MNTLNAQIEDVTLGYEEHGILTFWLTLNIAGGGGCCYGGIVLDNYDPVTGKRIPTAKAFECLTEIMHVVGVKNWEDLKGKYIRIKEDCLRRKVDAIGNLMEDKWFSLDDFFEE